MQHIFRYTPKTCLKQHNMSSSPLDLRQQLLKWTCGQHPFAANFILLLGLLCCLSRSSAYIVFPSESSITLPTTCTQPSNVEVSQLPVQVSGVNFDSTFEKLPYSVDDSGAIFAAVQSTYGGTRVSIYRANNKRAPGMAPGTPASDITIMAPPTDPTSTTTGSSIPQPGSSSGPQSGSGSGSGSGFSSSSFGEADLLSQLTQPSALGRFTTAALHQQFLAVALTWVPEASAGARAGSSSGSNSRVGNGSSTSATGGLRGQVRIYNTRWELLTQVWVPSRCLSLAWAPDGRRLYLSCKGSGLLGGSLGGLQLAPTSGEFLVINVNAVSQERVGAGVAARLGLQDHIEALPDAEYLALLAGGLRQRLPGAPSRAVALGSLQPGPLALADDGRAAFFVLQEHNAIGRVDLSPLAEGSPPTLALLPLGLKAWGGMVGGRYVVIEGKRVFRHNRTKSWYMPSDIRYVRSGGRGLLLTANAAERPTQWPALRLADIKDSQIDTFALPDWYLLKRRQGLGQMAVDPYCGLREGPRLDQPYDNQGPYVEFCALGGRSLSLWDAGSGALVWDSGALLQGALEGQVPAGESPDGLGPQARAVEVVRAQVPLEGAGRLTALLALTEPPGLAAFDITDPGGPGLMQLLTWQGSPMTALAPDLPPPQPLLRHLPASRGACAHNASDAWCDESGEAPLVLLQLAPPDRTGWVVWGNTTGGSPTPPGALAPTPPYTLGITNDTAFLGYDGLLAMHSLQPCYGPFQMGGGSSGSSSSRAVARAYLAWRIRMKLLPNLTVAPDQPASLAPLVCDRLRGALGLTYCDVTQLLAPSDPSAGTVLDAILFTGWILDYDAIKSAIQRDLEGFFNSTSSPPSPGGLNGTFNGTNTTDSLDPARSNATTTIVTPGVLLGPATATPASAGRSKASGSGSGFGGQQDASAATTQASLAAPASHPAYNPPFSIPSDLVMVEPGSSSSAPSVRTPQPPGSGSGSITLLDPAPDMMAPASSPPPPTTDPGSGPGSVVGNLTQKQLDLLALLPLMTKASSPRAVRSFNWSALSGQRLQGLLLDQGIELLPCWSGCPTTLLCAPGDREDATNASDSADLSAVLGCSANGYPATGSGPYGRSPQSDSDSGPDTAVLVGAVVGSVVGAIALVIAVWGGLRFRQYLRKVRYLDTKEPKGIGIFRMAGKGGGSRVSAIDPSASSPHSTKAGQPQSRASSPGAATSSTSPAPSPGRGFFAVGTGTLRSSSSSLADRDPDPDALDPVMQISPDPGNDSDTDPPIVVAGPAMHAYVIHGHGSSMDEGAITEVPTLGVARLLSPKRSPGSGGAGAGADPSSPSTGGPPWREAAAPPRPATYTPMSDGGIGAGAAEGRRRWLQRKSSPHAAGSGVWTGAGVASTRSATTSPSGAGPASMFARAGGGSRGAVHPQQQGLEERLATDGGWAVLPGSRPSPPAAPLPAFLPNPEPAQRGPTAQQQQQPPSHQPQVDTAAHNSGSSFREQASHSQQQQQQQQQQCWQSSRSGPLPRNLASGLPAATEPDTWVDADGVEHERSSREGARELRYVGSAVIARAECPPTQLPSPPAAGSGPRPWTSGSMSRSGSLRRSPSSGSASVIRSPSGRRSHGGMAPGLTPSPPPTAPSGGVARPVSGSVLGGEDAAGSGSGFGSSFAPRALKAIRSARALILGGLPEEDPSPQHAPAAPAGGSSTTLFERTRRNSNGGGFGNDAGASSATGPPPPLARGGAGGSSGRRYAGISVAGGTPGELPELDESVDPGDDCVAVAGDGMMTQQGSSVNRYGTGTSSRLSSPEEAAKRAIRASISGSPGVGTGAGGSGGGGTGWFGGSSAGGGSGVGGGNSRGPPVFSRPVSARPSVDLP